MCWAAPVSSGAAALGRSDCRATAPRHENLAGRKLRVNRPRLRKRGVGRDGQVPVPAYEAMRRDGRLGNRMPEILLRDVSTRQYKDVPPRWPRPWACRNPA
jgi:hypothetical protein